MLTATDSGGNTYTVDANYTFAVTSFSPYPIMVTVGSTGPVLSETTRQSGFDPGAARCRRQPNSAVTIAPTAIQPLECAKKSPAKAGL